MNWLEALGRFKQAEIKESGLPALPLDDNPFADWSLFISCESQAVRHPEQRRRLK
jgi:hypothetical protein